MSKAETNNPSANEAAEPVGQHPCNTARGNRISLLHPIYKDLHNNQGVLVDHEGFVSDLLADLRHYCDAHNLCFGDRDRLGHTHYQAELEDPDCNGMMKPEDIFESVSTEVKS
jgi:hypothetical protein